MTKIIIDASKTKLLPNFRELYRYRDLFVTLSWRDFRVRYAQTSIGILWAVVQPVITIFILSLVFTELAGVKTPVPGPLFIAAGMAVWSYFSFVMTNSGDSIISSQDMIKKIYFPRLIIPLSKAVVGLIDLGISILILIILMIYYNEDVTLTGNAWMAPLFILMGMIAALGVGIWLSALTVRFRDFKHVVPFMVQIGLYITPIAYPSTFVTEKLPTWAANLYFLNPMAGVIQGFRWSLFGGEAPGTFTWISLAMILFIFVTGILYFTKVEKTMADYV